MDPWKHSPVIYEINTLIWLGELARKSGHPVTLMNVPVDAWDALAQFNIDAVWLMGVWKRSPAGIAISNSHAGNLADFRRTLPDFAFSDNAGSPYCIREYVADDEFGGDLGLAVARRELARRGIKLILDFVPNHLAHDHPWVHDHPEYFIRGNAADRNNDPVTFVKIEKRVFACGKDPYYPAWQDVLQVNAFHPGLRKGMTAILRKIAGQCDGIRCDMAMLLMNDIFEKTWGTRAGQVPAMDYWEELIPAVKREQTDFLFIAEAYWDREWALQQQGFDFSYDKRLYDRLEKEDADSIRLHLTADIAFQSKLIRFIENHDEERAAVSFPGPKMKAATVAFSTLPGAKLFHEGQFEGRRTRLPVFLRRRPAEAENEKTRSFYSMLLKALRHPLFGKGRWQLCEISGWPDDGNSGNVLAWTWSENNDRLLVAINYSDQPAQGLVKVQPAGTQGITWHFRDLLSGAEFERDGDEIHSRGLFISLGPWEFHVLASC